jgi:hypothetical protein
MAFVLKDRVKETTTTSGTGSVTLAGAVQGYQGFTSIGDGNTTYYTIAGVAEWEVGIGTYSAGVLSRDTVLASSANGNKIAFSSGVKDVFCTYAADKAIAVDTLPIAIATTISAPNATVNVASITSATASANGDLALVSKGTGALTVQIPTNTVAGGNKRGQYATDFQRSRSFASEVASGNYSAILGGTGHAVAGLRGAAVGGQSNRASGENAVVIGGASSTASGQESGVFGSYLSGATGFLSTVVGGDSNSAEGFESIIVGGSQNSTTADYAVVIGGARGDDRGIKAIVVMPASYKPFDDKNGVAQTALLALGKETTNATSARLTCDGASASTNNQLILADNSAVYFKGSVIANVTGAGNTKSWTFDGQIKRGANAASTVLTGSTVSSPYGDAGASTWAVALAADTTNGGLAVTVTGQASTTIRWVCKLETTEVSF